MLDPRIKLRHLVTFLEVARQGSVVRAAAVLGVSQPAASRTIAELEDLLGVALFDRSRRNLFPTGFGEVFLRHAGASVSALAQGIDAVGQARSAEAAVVRIGALPTVSARVLPRAVGLYTREAIGPRAQVITGPNAFLLAQLAVGEVDFVVGRMAEPEAMSGFSFEHLYSERVAFVVRAGHPLAGRDPFALGDVTAFPVVMPPAGAVIRPAVDRFLVANGLGRLRGEVETVSDVFGRAYVRGSDAVWIISEGVVVDELAEGRLVALPVDTSETLGPVGLTTRIDTTLSLGAALLVKAVRAVVAAQARGG